LLAAWIPVVQGEVLGCVIVICSMQSDAAPAHWRPMRITPAKWIEQPLGGGWHMWT